MKRIAIVVHRCHQDIVGGSETLAWHYAQLLSRDFQVEVLTTTAMDHVTWDNALPEGVDPQENFVIRRFPVTIGRQSYWYDLNGRFVRDWGLRQSGGELSFHRKWTIGLQEEYIRYQGPYSDALIRFLREQHGQYDKILFVTYLYPTVYFGMREVPPSKAILVPTLHDEPQAYLDIFRFHYGSVDRCIWLTSAEQKLSAQLWAERSGMVVGMAINTELHSAREAASPYLLYCGRIEGSKGCEDLVRYFTQFKDAHPSSLRLVLTGRAYMELPDRPDIDFRGFVTDEEKFQLMAGATALIMSSPYESFSIVTLEAMAQKTPVLVNGACQVLVEHVQRSQGGLIYRDYATFLAAVQQLLGDESECVQMGDRARQYILENYTLEAVRNRLYQAVDLSLHCAGQEVLM